MSIVTTREQVPRLAAPVRRAVSVGGGPAAGITIRDVLRIIRKRKWLILLTFAVVVSVVLTATLLWWLYAPWFTAKAYLAVSPSVNTIMMENLPIWSKEVIERGKRTQAALVKDQRVLEAVATDPRVTNKGWYSRNKHRIYEALDEDIEVSLLPETEYILISMTGMARDELADIVNAVADAFVRFAGQSPQRQRNDQVAKLKSKADALKTQLSTVRRDIATAKGASPLAAMETRRSTLTIRLQMLVEQVQEAELDQVKADAALKSYQQDEEQGKLARNPDVTEYVDRDPVLRALKVQLMEEQTRLDNAVWKFGPKHRQTLSLEAVVNSLSQQIEGRGKELMLAAVDGLGQMRLMASGQTLQRVVDLTTRLNAARLEARDLEDAVGRIDALSQEAKDLEENLHRIEQRVTDIELVGRQGRTGEEAFETGPVTVGAYATNPRTISQPKWNVMIAAGVLAGLFLGFGLAFLLELADTSVKTPSDIARRVDLPLLGMIPHGDDMDEDIEDFRRVTLLAPHSLATEAFRQVRTNLLFSGPAQERRSLLVTSPAPEDGRTTVVLNLAASMAQSGRRVLVVDANFRQPAIAGMFPQAAAAGLSSALVGQAAWRDVVSPTGVPNLSVITAGPLPPNPAELLGSETMRKLVTEMVAEYDQVIFDGSPVMVVSDALVLSTQVDGVVLVVRAHANSVGIVQRASEQLHRVGARILGVVLQGVRTTAGGYLRKNYETFYEYQRKPLP